MIDLSNDRKSVEIQILGYIRKEQIVPFRVLQHYAHILTVENGGASTPSEGGSSNGGSSSLTQTNVKDAIDSSEATKELIEIRKYLTSSEAKIFNDLEFTANSTSQTALTSSTDYLEVVLQNKSKTEFLYLTLNSSSTITRSLTIPPLGIITFDDYLASLEINVITEGNNVPVYIYYVSKVGAL